jgi:hypothetical protein
VRPVGRQRRHMMMKTPCWTSRCTATNKHTCEISFPICPQFPTRTFTTHDHHTQRERWNVMTGGCIGHTKAPAYIYLSDMSNLPSMARSPCSEPAA